MRPLYAIAILFVGSIAYWQGVSLLSVNAEPWDSPGYGIAYLLALGIALVAGWVIGRKAWLIGLAISFAQLPVMLWNSTLGPMAAFGILILAALAVPLMGVAGLGIYIRKRRAH